MIAERLPKALIHHNVPGEPVHRFLADLDAAWARHAGHTAYGARQRFGATAAALQDAGWPLLGRPGAVALGELTVDWSAVAPLAHHGP